MKGIKVFLLSLGLGAFLVASSGCGSKVVKEFEKIKDEMCACKDKDCAEKVNKKFEDWLKKNEKAKGSKGQQEKAKKVAEEYTKCMMTAMAGTAAGGDEAKPEEKPEEKTE
jgi:hypothetical protein